jgi:hypothetical protein
MSNKKKPGAAVNAPEAGATGATGGNEPTGQAGATGSAETDDSQVAPDEGGEKTTPPEGSVDELTDEERREKEVQAKIAKTTADLAAKRSNEAVKPRPSGPEKTTPPEGSVRCLVVGPGGVFLRGKLIPEGATALFPASDLSKPQLKRV